MTQLPSPVTITHRDGLAVVRVNNPPVNALSIQVRQGLLDAFASLAQEPAVKGVVLTGSANSFIAGADIREMDGPLASPMLPEVVEAVEALPKPVIAVLEGSALGGGLEIALACDYRIAVPNASVGLPETKLGVIPGAGGTQRLARVVGVANAIELICEAKILSASAAQAQGIVDEIVADHVLEAACALLPTLRKRPLSLVPMPRADFEVDQKAFDTAVKRAKGAPAIIEAANIIHAARDDNFDANVSKERAAFLRLRESKEAAALRYLFFAERESWKASDLGKVEARPIRRVGIIGAGTMGAGIAVALVLAGLPIVVVEKDVQTASAGSLRIHNLYNEYKRRSQADTLRALPEYVLVTADWDKLRDCDLIIEAAFESLDIKREIFARLDTVASPEAILASNTSYLDLDAIARVTSRPQQVVGLHFFSPAHIMKLLEIIRGSQTAPEVLATALALCKRLGKQPVMAANGEGFIGNRIYAAYRRHAEYLVEDGTPPQEIDKALEAYGFAMGIFAASDLSGLDIAYEMRQRRAATRNPKERYVAIPDKLCDLGRLGRKTGAGWYAYADGKPMPDPIVEQIIGEEQKRRQVLIRRLSQEEIQARLLAVMANEGAKLLSEGIALRASDVDVALVNGYGFPRIKGGPMWDADRRGLSLIQSEMEAAFKVGGAGSEPANLLSELGRTGARLSQWRRA